jgi:hypothetical protein
MDRDQRHSELPKEILAVLKISPNLEPCHKFRKSDIIAFAKHVNEGQCQQCIAFYRQAAKELEMMKFLRDNRN